MDANDPIVILCAQGMASEQAGDVDRAKALFMRAWDEAGDDYQRCIAAHYVARHQVTPEATLQWNETCMRLADAVGDDRVAGFYPSLLLNIAHSHEELGDVVAARAAYLAAERRLGILGEGPYADMVRDGVQRGLGRVTT